MCGKGRNGLLGIVAAATVLAASCGGGSSGSDQAGSAGAADAEVLPFELVQANDFSFEADPTDPGRGIFRVRTTEPMICAIVWGETEAFGNFNNSLSMNGTGIVDHDVILPGAEAGRTYYFRVQGSTADGGLYQSETGTFTIPPLDAASDGSAEESFSTGENLALGAEVVEASSVFGTGWEAANAVDGDTNTEWATSGDGDQGFITIDLGQVRDVAALEFLTRSMLDGTATTESYTVTVDEGDVYGPFPAGNPADPNPTAVDLAGRILRFDVDASTGGNVGAIEIRVLAPPSDAGSDG